VEIRWSTVGRWGIVRDPRVTLDDDIRAVSKGGVGTSPIDRAQGSRYVTTGKRRPPPPFIQRGIFQNELREITTKKVVHSCTLHAPHGGEHDAQHGREEREHVGEKRDIGGAGSC
jgi:hypothetical protein